jgi:poly(A) polymerase
MASSPEKEVERLIQTVIIESPWKSHVYSVGGFVRDDLLGLQSKDLDLVVEQQQGSEKFSHWIKELFPEDVSQPYKVGATYPIWHLKFFHDVCWNGQRYFTENAELDIADTQRDAADYPGATEFGSLSEDILRRDFTVNMFLRDLSTGEVIDPTGVSLPDLKLGLLRGHPQVATQKVIEADPLRMLRAIRLSCKYGWKINASVEDAVKANAHLIQRISHERIRDELIHIMEYGKLADAVTWMDQVGLLGLILPEVQAMKGVEQDRVYHSEGDVWTHTLLLVRKAKAGVIPQISALLHDVGKPQTQTIHPPEKPGELRRIKFLDHENVGAEISDEILRRLKFENTVIEKVNKIIRLHLRAHFSEEWSPKAVRKYVRDCGEEIDEILHISEIDSLSSYGPDGLPKENQVPELRKRIARVTQIPIRKKTVLSGNEVMELLNISPGKAVGEALLVLQDIEDEYAVQGMTLDQESARRILKERYK